LLDKYVPSVDLPVEYYCLIFLVPLIMLCQIKHLKFLAIFSVVANVLLVATYLICLYYIFGKEVNFTDKNTMKKPQNFLGCPSVLVVSMSAIVFLYSTLVCAKIFIALSIFLTYPLQFFVVIDIFTKYTEPLIKDKYQRVTQLAARTVGVCCCACFYSILGLIIPSIIETVFRWDDLGKFKWVFWKNLFILLFGLTALVSGCTVTVMDIIEILHKKNQA
ncbi:Amino acid transporter, partial [Operophtera brumata]